LKEAGSLSENRFSKRVAKDSFDDISISFISIIVILTPAAGAFLASGEASVSPIPTSGAGVAITDRVMTTGSVVYEGYSG
jgi:hypothetical protein